MSYPSAPWQLQGQLWLSLFRVSTAVDAERPAGLYGAAFVSYEPDSPLTYSELLVARPVDRQVRITDIWVDSPDSMAGGRELWAIPKELCDFRLETGHTGPLSRTEWSATLERRPIAEARFTDVSRAALRLPFRAGVHQPPLEAGGPEGRAAMRGTARTLPCRGHWDFAPDGPLGWLAGRRPVASLRMAGFRMSFG
ncbi:acetoacetate decarboxylase family protein [Nocardioides sp. MAHUQ-72]|uniref:acetoacetate decarboxylase family protein n=1 Tax=unclassified Nocardioides TaxID=2615069 RepID=UPI00361358BE